LTLRYSLLLFVWVDLSAEHTSAVSAFPDDDRAAVAHHLAAAEMASEPDLAFDALFSCAACHARYG